VVLLPAVRKGGVETTLKGGMFSGTEGMTTAVTYLALVRHQVYARRALPLLA